MIIYLEILEKTLEKKEIYYKLKTQTKHNTLKKAQKALNDAIILTDEKTRIHKCFHDENPQKPCEIL